MGWRIQRGQVFYIWLAAAVALGAWLRFGKLGDFDNSYYTATVVSMLKSPANFLFASFDPGGIVSVDKPPASFWIQAIPVALLGPSRWAVGLPQAVAGTASVILLYLLLRPAFGRMAAVSAAFALAVIPASVMIDSRNEPDSLLSFSLLLAAGAIFMAARTGKLRWLLAFAGLMGVAFNIKMLAAFVPLPAFIAYYLLASKLPVKSLALRAAMTVAVLGVLSFSWTTLVALTPPDNRPYVGSTRDNSIWTLAFKYNGLDRFTSFIGPRPRGQAGLPPQQASPLPGYPPPAGSQVGALSATPDLEGVALLRLFTQRLAAQAGWLLPIALLMLMVVLASLLPESVYRRPAALLGLLRGNPQASQTVLWGGWFATAVVAFGLADSTTTHPYYLAALAVPMAAVLGMGFAALWRLSHNESILAWLLPGACLGGALYQVLSARGLVVDWAMALPLALMPLAVLGMAVALWRRVAASHLASAFAIMGALTLLVIPLASAAQAGGAIVGPAAGLAGAAPPPRPGPGASPVPLVSSFIRQRGDGGSIFVVGAVNAREAASFIISGTPALAIGGFSGNDPIFTPESFRAMAGRGEVRYFLMPGPGGPGGGPGGRLSQEPILAEIRRSWEDVSLAAGLPRGSLYRFRSP